MLANLSLQIVCVTQLKVAVMIFGHKGYFPFVNYSLCAVAIV